MAKVTCDNCDWVGDDDDEGFTPLEDCEGLLDRLDPGSEVPAGQCPECRCFCYVVKDEPLKEFIVETASGRRTWSAVDACHAREQHEDALHGEDDEVIISIREIDATYVLSALIEWNKQNGHCVDKPWLDAMRYMGVTENS